MGNSDIKQTILVMPNMISAFKDLDCATNVYWGTSAGRSHYFGDYFRGLAYAMSWPLVCFFFFFFLSFPASLVDQADTVA